MIKLSEKINIHLYKDLLDSTKGKNCTNLALLGHIGSIGGNAIVNMAKGYSKMM